MKIILYNNFSENNKLDKNIVKIIELDGDLREASSLINPSILIELNPSTLVDSNVIDDNGIYVMVNGIKVTWNNFIYNYVLSANYVYIPEFNRYYFINDIISVRTNMWRLNMHVDVLMSYKNQIKQMNAFVNRNEFEYDEMIKDDLVSYYYDKEVTEYIPTKGNKVNMTFSPTREIIANNVLLTVINEDIGITLESATPPDNSLPVVTSSAAGTCNTSRTYLTYVTMLSRLAKRLNGDDSNLVSFVLSIMIFPFSLPQQGADFNLKLGTTILSDTGSTEEPNGDNVDVAHPKKELTQYLTIADFTITADSFLDYEPYTQYEIYLPYLGWVSLSADNILNNRLLVYYVVDYATGSSQVCIYDTTHSKIIYTGNAQLGIKVGITSTNQREVNDNRNSNNIGLGVGLLTSAVSTIAGIATWNPVAIAGGVISAGSTIAKFVQNSNTNYLRASGSVNSGLTGLYLPQEVKIRKTKLKPKNYDEYYARLFGKPLNKYMKLEDLSGYTILGEVHIEDIGSITSNEFDELYAILTTGFII